MRIIIILCLTLIFQLTSSIPVYGSGVVQGSFTVPDHSQPSAITDLTVIGITSYSVQLRWTAPGNDGDEGTATCYDIRYSTLFITGENRWNTSNKAYGVPTPGPSGTVQTFTINGLLPYTTYYFAIKTGDEQSNWSPLSNVVSATTTMEYMEMAQDDATVTPPSASAVVPTTPPAVAEPLQIDIMGERGVFFLDLLPGGTLAQDMIITLYDSHLVIIIKKGTVFLDKTGKPISVLVLERVGSYGTAPPGYQFEATYDFQPSCVIEPTIEVKMRYDRQKLGTDVDEEAIHIAYYNQDQERWVSLHSTRDAATQFASAKIAHFSLFSLLVPKSVTSGVSSNATAAEPNLSVTNLYLSSNVIKQGESLVVHVDVVNESDMAGEFYLPLLYNGVTLDSKTVSLASQQEKEESFTVVLNEEGTHSIGVGSMFTTVIVNKSETSVIDDFSWLRTPLIWLSMVGIGIVLVIILINRWRRNNAYPRDY